MQKKMIQRDQDTDPLVDDNNVSVVMHAKHKCPRLCTLVKLTSARPSRHSALCSTRARLTSGWWTVRIQDVSCTLYPRTRNLAVGNKTKFDSSKSSTYKSLGGRFHIQYGRGAVDGITGQDVVGVGVHTIVFRVAIVCSSPAHNSRSPHKCSVRRHALKTLDSTVNRSMVCAAWRSRRYRH